MKKSMTVIAKTVNVEKRKNVKTKSHIHKILKNIGVQNFQTLLICNKVHVDFERQKKKQKHSFLKRIKKGMVENRILFL
jgi:RNase H-fold protein (predicted Holliday junction resolvase)